MKIGICKTEKGTFLKQHVSQAAEASCCTIVHQKLTAAPEENFQENILYIALFSQPSSEI